MSPAELHAILPVPREPKYRATERDLEVAESKLKIRLPPEYKQFAKSYGSGCIDHFIWVFTPSTPNNHLCLQERAPLESSSIHELKDDDPTSIPFDIYPGRNGFLPWAVSDDSDLFLMSPAGKKQKIAVVPRHSISSECFNCDFRTFVHDLLTGSIRIKSLPRDFPEEPHGYSPEM